MEQRANYSLTRLLAFCEEMGIVSRYEKKDDLVVIVRGTYARTFDQGQAMNYLKELLAFSPTLRHAAQTICLADTDD